MGGGSVPSAPKPVNSYYDLGNGSTASQTFKKNNVTLKYNPSAYEQQQTAFLQSQIPQLQQQLLAGNQEGANTYADNIKKLGMERFNQDMNDTLRTIQQNNVNRFGSLSNSSYGDTLSRASQEFGKQLADLNTQYDVNAQNYRNNEFNYINGLLGTLTGNYQNQLGNAQSMAGGVQSGFNSGNNLNQQNYQNQLYAYANKPAGIMQTLGGLGSMGLGSYLGGGGSLAGLGSGIAGIGSAIGSGASALGSAIMPALGALAAI